MLKEQKEGGDFSPLSSYLISILTISYHDCFSFWSTFTFFKDLNLNHPEGDRKKENIGRRGKILTNTKNNWLHTRPLFFEHIRPSQFLPLVNFHIF